jgi:hypothetical protein
MIPPTSAPRMKGYLLWKKSKSLGFQHQLNDKLNGKRGDAILDFPIHGILISEMLVAAIIYHWLSHSQEQ